MQKILKCVSRKLSSFHGQESTIYALATAAVLSPVAVVRVSGPSTRKVLQDIGRFKPERFPKARVATVKKLYDQNGSLLDNSMVLWFPGPHSYTGEDCCEFHIHGGPAVITGVLKSISMFQDCRMAEPGEFTRRAFLNGKMDLTEIDGLGDLIAAETEMQRVQALNQMNGSLGKLYETWRDRIAKCLANVEAYIDFAEDENIEADILETVEQEVLLLVEEIQSHIRDDRKGERLRSGVSIAIVGKPNVGKSSLLNLLCKREAAIVSDIPGTTRDVVQAIININGYPVVLADTAGIRRDPGDVVETEGIRRALKEATEADLLILLLDVSEIQSFDVEKKDLLNDGICHFLIHQGQFDAKQWENKIIVVGNKSDLSEKNNNNINHSLFDCTISCKTLQGYEDFLLKLGSRVSLLCANPKSEQVYITRERYRSHLENCVSHLVEYKNFQLAARRTGDLIDFALQAVPLKDAMNSIGCITGHYGTEQILDIIFRDFCIGK